MTEPVLDARGLVVRRGPTEIIRGVDLRAERGEVVALLGPNGAGKSTLLAAIGGLLPLHGGHLGRSGTVATVLQNAGLAGRTALANVELALAWSGTRGAPRRARAARALELMRADHLARRPARSLSGGEQRRVHLARAVAVAPDLLLLDEPFDGLDPQTHAAVLGDTATALRAAGSAVVIVLHHRADAWAVADRLVVLVDGTVHADGTPHDVLRHPADPDVARFLGYDGELVTGAGLTMTRAADVRLAPDGELQGRVDAVVNLEDGQRLRLETADGHVWATSPSSTGRVGDQVRAHVLARVEFGPEARADRRTG